MRRNRQRRLGLIGIMSCVTALLAPFLVAGPAQAYGSLTVRWATVDTDNCQRTGGNLTVTALADSCFLDDSADDTWFIKDVDGVALKIQLHDSNGMVAKVEFHPYGEHLWVYDTRDDGDAVYTRVFWNGFPHENGRNYTPPATGNDIDLRDFDLNFPENALIQLTINDDAGGLDDIVRLSQVGGARA